MTAATVFRLRPGWRLQWEPVQGRHVLLYPEGMVQLNDSAGAVLALVDGQRDLAAILAALGERFPEAAADVLADDVREFLADALAQGWIRDTETT